MTKTLFTFRTFTFGKETIYYLFIIELVSLHIDTLCQSSQMFGICTNFSDNKMPFFNNLIKCIFNI